MTVHYLKIKPEYYKDVECGLKTFELRKNDRNFQVGDTLMLIKLDDKGNETDQVRKVKVNYILKDCPQYGLKDGYAILGIIAEAHVNIKGVDFTVKPVPVCLSDLDDCVKDRDGNVYHVGDIGKGDGVAKMKESEDVKQRIDEAEEELRELFKDLIYEHCDNGGEYQLNNLASGFNTLLKYAREWQQMNEEGKK